MRLLLVVSGHPSSSGPNFLGKPDCPRELVFHEKNHSEYPRLIDGRSALIVPSLMFLLRETAIAGSLGMSSRIDLNQKASAEYPGI